jgi:hypothetical protein
MEKSEIELKWHPIPRASQKPRTDSKSPASHRLSIQSPDQLASIDEKSNLSGNVEVASSHSPLCFSMSVSGLPVKGHWIKNQVDTGCHKRDLFFMISSPFTFTRRSEFP